MKPCQSLNRSHIAFERYERNRGSFRAICTIGGTHKETPDASTSLQHAAQTPIEQPCRMSRFPGVLMLPL